MSLDWFTRLRDYGMEAISNRYYSKYIGKVTKNDDPQQQGRVKTTCGALGRSDELLNWAYPTTPFAGNNYGFYFPPEVDDPVWVWFENGDSQSPNFSGSWYCNPDPGLKATTSHVPAEFRSDTAASPTRRGLKSKRGHGFMFEDGVTADEDKKISKVEFWSGTQEEEGKKATKNRYLRMQDSPAGEKTIVIASTSGHQTEWRDVTGEIRIETKTAGGHKFTLDDTKKNISLVTKTGHYVKLDDNADYIELKTVGGHIIRMHDTSKKIELISKTGHRIVLDDNVKQILLRSKDLRQVVLDDLLQQITVQNKAGQSVVMGLTGTTITEPGAVTVAAQGAVAVSGNGVSVTSTSGPMVTNAGGVSTNTFTGAVTENYNGALSMIILGILTISNTVLAIAGNTVGVGPGARFRLVDERFLVPFNAHLHTTTLAGAPTGPPLFPVSPTGIVTVNTTAS